MFNEKVKSQDVATSSLIAGGSAANSASAKGFYKVQCLDVDGNLKWEAEAPNLVVNGGLQDMNNKYFLGSAYTATWYLGLYGSGATNSPAAGDTMSSHAGWTEVVAYSQATALFVHLPHRLQPTHQWLQTQLHLQHSVSTQQPQWAARF
jgi:hypothetical protein